MSSSDQLGLTFQVAAARRVWRVADLVSAARTSLEREYSDVWVEGEISNLRFADSGHLYFTLKDGDAQLRIVIFRSSVRLLRFKPADGLAVIARGRMTIYEPRGELQLSAEYLEPKGAGALQIAFEQLKAKLAAEGLFDAARKKPLPALPGRIGIVTSPRGAAIQDMLNILRRRHASVPILIYPAQVQGEAASAEVRAGVQYFNRARNVDVIIVARGGGSIEDLAAFNDEDLARSIADSAIPVISAVGHEIDFTITDFVADLRAPTPSAAAELVIESRYQLEERVASLRQRIARGARYRLLLARQVLTEWAQDAAFARMHDALARRQQRVDDLVYRMVSAERHLLRQCGSRLDVAGARIRHFDVRRQLAAMAREIDSHTSTLSAAMRRFLLIRRAHWERSGARLEEMSPLRILDRGYALVFDSTGRLLKDVADIRVGDEISTHLARGTFVSTVKHKSGG